MRNNSVSVKQLNAYIKNVFEDELVLQNITVVGEVSDVSNSKYVFLTLKEDDYILQCMSFSKIPLPEIGQKVALSGSVSFSERYAKVSFIFKSIINVGEGEKQAELEEIKKRLKEKGYFEKKKSLPAFIKNVCVITSGFGSVVHDFLSGISAHSYIDATIYPCSVQGDTAEKELLDCLRKADKGNFDVIVVARGGGSKEDLSCFNLESVATAVGDMSAPVISAVGHETDFTLCDACASVRAGTPSFAAKIICENNALFIDKFSALAKKCGDAVGRKLNNKIGTLMLLTNALTYLAGNEYFRAREKTSNLAASMRSALEEKFRSGYKNIENLSGKLYEKIYEKQASAEKNISDAMTKLECLSPLKTMKRGYSVATKEGRTLSSVKDIAPGDKIDVAVTDGKFCAVVEDREKNS